MKRRILAIILSLALVITLTPMTASAVSVTDYKSLGSNFNTGAVQNDPTHLNVLSVNTNTRIDAITTYHWNYGKGATPGTISIKMDGQVVGTWQATGRSGSGANNVYWDAFPHYTMVPGHEYTIVDSGEATWSWNSGTGGAGMMEIFGEKNVATPTSNPAGYKTSAWAVGEVQDADVEGLIPTSMSGKDMTKPISRAEFAAVCVLIYQRMSNTTVPAVKRGPFTDTKDPEVLKAFALGIVNGTSATTFSPNSNLTREQASTMLTRAYKAIVLPGWSLDTDSKFKLSYTKPAAFADQKSISSYATESVAYMASKGILKGMGNNLFKPKDNVTREQALAIAIRMLETLDTTPQEVNPDDGLSLRTLSYNFLNSWSGFNYPNPYRIPLEKFKMMLGDNERAKALWDDDWGGSCYGMVSSSGLFYKSGNGINVTSYSATATLPNDLKITDRDPSTNWTLRDFIELMHVSQFTYRIQQDYQKNKGMDNLAKAVQQIKKGEPAIITIFGVVGGHAVLGYEVQEGSGTDKLMIYDPNFPNKERYITLYKNNSGSYYDWYYKMNDKYDYGENYTNGWISYMPYNDYYLAWEDRNKSASTMALITTNGDVNITTPDGQKVANLSDGEVTMYKNNVTPFIVIGVTPDGKSPGSGMTAAWIPAGEYNVERASTDTTGSKLEVKITHVEQSVSVVTGADSMTLEVNDNTKTRTASLGASESGSSFKITIGSSLDDDSEPAVITLEGSVSSGGTSLGKDAGEFIHEGTNNNDIVIQYDGGVG
ncbi:MAG: S-layer homology domain-containing protein [Firmicutes bacterium]|nr:S-layer homology domain-containing protein [Bacillota bacterium]